MTLVLALCEDGFVLYFSEESDFKREKSCC